MQSQTLPSLKVQYRHYSARKQVHWPGQFCGPRRIWCRRPSWSSQRAATASSRRCKSIWLVCCNWCLGGNFCPHASTLALAWAPAPGWLPGVKVERRADLIMIPEGKVFELQKRHPAKPPINQREDGVLIVHCAFYKKKADYVRNVQLSDSGRTILNVGFQSSIIERTTLYKQISISDITSSAASRTRAASALARYEQ